MYYLNEMAPVIMNLGWEKSMAMQRVGNVCSQRKPQMHHVLLNDCVLLPNYTL